MGRLATLYPRIRPPRPRLTPGAKKRGLMRSWLSRHPVWIAWQVTYRCNMRCTFCNYWKTPSRPEDELSVEGFREGSRRLADLGAILVSLAGGEPFVRDDLVDIVEAVGQYHFPFITTNGWNVDERIAREVYHAGCWGVSVSLDYADAARHDAQRGREGAFDRAVAAIEALSRARQHRWQRVNVMCVLVEDNLAEVERLLELAARFDAYVMVQPYSNLKTGEADYSPTEAVSRHLLELRRRHGNFLSNPYFLSRFDEFFATGEVPGCLAGRSFWNIDERGNVAICVENRDRPVGNVLETPPAELVRRLRAAGLDNRCNACWYNCRGEIEALAHPWGMLKSLPTYLFNWGRPSHKPAWRRPRTAE